VKALKKKKITRVFAVAVITSVIVTIASYLGYLDFMQRKAQDLMVWWKEPESPSKIVIIAIDEEAFHYLGEKQPLPRKYLASLISLLQKSGAKVIGLDIELKTKTDRDADAAIEQAFTERTVIPYEVIPSSREGVYTAVPLFISENNVPKGFANTYIDGDGVIRRAPLALKDEKGSLIFSFALTIFTLFTQETNNSRTDPDMHPGIVGVLFIKFGLLRSAVLSISGILLFFVPLSYLAYTKGNYWVDFVLPVIAVAFASIVNDYFERKKIRESFSQYVSREVVEKIYKDESSLEGQHKTVTVLFADMRGFTTLSEDLEIGPLISILNDYLAMIADTVLKNGGMINKFIGDAVMAIYGAPVDRPDHAVCAVRTAFEIQKGIEELNRQWKDKGIASIRIGIGIHTGEVFAGNIGSEKRKEYTIIGDTVNLASRIEGLNKELSTSVLISEDTYGLLHDVVEAGDMGIMNIRGRHKPVRVYELRGVSLKED
jgi:class 3 adenylate cyclase